MQVPIATAEDVLLAKLEWAKLGEPARQTEDVAGILRIRAADLDLGYIPHRARELEVEAQWAAACRVAAR